jgi:hypothetical protein
MDLCVADLKQRGKGASAGDAQSVFSLHASHLRPLPANALTRQDVTDTLRKVVDSGKGRSAGVLRSYLAAAFKRALDAEDDDSIPTDFLIFRRAGLERNPAAETKALTQFVRPRERHLTEAEFRHLWRKWLFSSDGTKALHPDTLTHLVSDLSKAMLDAGEITTPFQMKDIRRTLETTLSRMGVSELHRAQLQSHGLSGVQARHYDKHNYLAEKKSASLKLTAWMQRVPQICYA